MPKSKPTRKRKIQEYTGPPSLEEVKKFYLSNATQKAKTKAAEMLSEADQIELMKWATQTLSTEMKRFMKNIEIERKLRGL